MLLSQILSRALQQIMVLFSQELKKSVYTPWQNAMDAPSLITRPIGLKFCRLSLNLSRVGVRLLTTSNRGQEAEVARRQYYRAVRKCFLQFEKISVTPIEV